MKNGALSNSLGVRFYIGSILCTELHRAVFGYVVGLTLYRGLCPDAWNDPSFFSFWSIISLFACSNSASRITSLVDSGLSKLSEVPCSNSSFFLAASIISCRVCSDLIFFFFGFASSAGKSLFSFLLKISGPLLFFPSLKWQLQTLVCFPGSLSSLLQQKGNVSFMILS